MNAELFGYYVKGREMFHAPYSVLMTVVTAGLLLYIIPAPGVSLSGGAGGGEASMESIKVVADFSDPAEIQRWRSVNDGVMGGVSSGAIAAGSDGTAVFEGVISLENNGGFASVRTAPRDFALDGFDGLLVRVNGDGKGYKLTARTDNAFDTVMYQAAFETDDGQWREIRIPFSDFTPTYHGRVLSDRAPLQGANVRGIGLLISDKQEGPFRLEIAFIKAYPAATAAEAPQSFAASPGTSLNPPHLPL